jgi:hypothetical protein
MLSTFRVLGLGAYLALVILAAQKGPNHCLSAPPIRAPRMQQAAHRAPIRRKYSTSTTGLITLGPR